MVSGITCSKECEACDGTGLIECDSCNGSDVDCHTCNGLYEVECVECDGTGEEEEEAMVYMDGDIRTTVVQGQTAATKGPMVTLEVNLSGPPRSGKTLVANILSAMLPFTQVSRVIIREQQADVYKKKVKRTRHAKKKKETTR